jgi:hypothetical protein
MHGFKLRRSTETADSLNDRAGGGVKGGTIYGATDEFGFKAVEKPAHVHDLHATILYLLGIDHTKLTYRYSGRDFRLTDVAGNVLHDIIA